jgi:glycosyltransferase involved in cell wall biosynthesis
MTAEKRVIVFNHFAVPRDQPGGTRHVELFSRLPGWNYTIIASHRNLSTGETQAHAPGFVFVPVTRYRANGMSRVLNWISYAITATFAALAKPRPDVVYASSPHLLAALAGWLVAKVRRARFVLEIRDLWPQVLVDMGHLQESSLLYRLLHELEKFLYRQAECIVVMAPGSKTALEQMGVAPSKITYIPNGADPEDFVPSADRETLRGKYGFTKLTAVYAGAHGPANGLSLLLDAADEIRELPIDIVLVGDGVLKNELMDTARMRDLRNVRFLAPIPKSEIPDLLAAADVGLHVLADVDLFRTSVSPNKVFDYMAAGLFVVTNCPGAVTELVETSGAGIGVGPTDLVEGLRFACKLDTAELTAAGDHGRAWLEREQSRTAMATRLEGILTSERPLQPHMSALPSSTMLDKSGKTSAEAGPRRSTGTQNDLAPPIRSCPELTPDGRKRCVTDNRPSGNAG